MNHDATLGSPSADPQPEDPAASRSPASGPASGPDAGAESPAEGPPDDPADDLAGRPETPLASLDELRAALDWAFEGCDAPPKLLDLYARHARLLLERNREVNLTSIVDPREMAAKHYLDSWRVTRYVSLYAKTVLDLGTGAGFPGLPIALADKEARVTLLDSTRKRVDFVQECIDALPASNATAVWARGEDHLLRNSVDVVVMRAVSSVRENVRTLRKVRHALKDLVMLKGPSWSREVRAGEREAERLGFKLDTVCEHELPGEMGKRAVLVYRAPGGQGS